MISFTPSDGVEINLFPVQSIDWGLPSGVKKAGYIQGVPVFYVSNTDNTIKIKITWVNKQIDGVDIDKYLKSHSSYGTLKIDNGTYDVYASFDIHKFPVVEGTAYQVSATFTVAE